MTVSYLPLLLLLLLLNLPHLLHPSLCPLILLLSEPMQTAGFPPWLETSCGARPVLFHQPKKKGKKNLCEFATVSLISPPAEACTCAKTPRHEKTNCARLRQSKHSPRCGVASEVRAVEAFETLQTHNGRSTPEQLLFQLLCDGNAKLICADCVSDGPPSA